MKINNIKRGPIASAMIAGILSLTCLIGVLSCSWFEEDRQDLPTAPAGSAIELGNYAQQNGHSRVVTVNGAQHQINWVVSEWGSFPYGEWLYVEINQQDAIGKQPGEHQVPVTLGTVMLHFRELPNDVTQIIIGVKVVHDANDQTFAERGRFTVVNGSVSIPVNYADLVAYFGVTHYSIWFQALGGANGMGVACGRLTVTGVMPNGQDVTFGQQVCFGTNPPPTPTSELAAAAPTAPSCTDGVQNGTETDVDCGGGSCAACAVGKGCSVGADCVSSVCAGNVCQAPSCTDGVQNGAETDVDCGGGSCAACAAGKGCSVGADCVSNVCAGNVCQSCGTVTTYSAACVAGRQTGHLLGAGDSWSQQDFGGAPPGTQDLSIFNEGSGHDIKVDIGNKAGACLPDGAGSYTSFSYEAPCTVGTISVQVIMYPSNDGSCTCP